MKSRKGERHRSFFRTERFQQANGAWYFLTRENIQEGPFRTQKEAMAALERHAAVWRSRLFSNTELDRINTLDLQTKRVRNTSENAPYALHQGFAGYGKAGRH